MFFVIADTTLKGRLQLVPHRAAIIATSVGWTVRNDLIWAKTDAAPGCPPTRWRCTHEHVFFLTRQPTAYKFDSAAIRVPYNTSTLRRWGNGQAYGGPKATVASGTKAQRFPKGKTFSLNPLGTIPPDVLPLPTARTKLKHYATFPPQLIDPLLLATTERGDVVFDPFTGTGTTGALALLHGRRFIGVELSPDYFGIAMRKLEEASTQAQSTTAPQS